MPLLEIEQNFSFTLANAAILACKGGSSPFKTLSNIQPQSFRDIYYDTQDQLFNAGLWLRKRQYYSRPCHPTASTASPLTSLEWEVKQRKHGGTFLRSIFFETKNQSEILELVRSQFPKLSLRFRDDFGLNAIAEFETHRLTVLTDGKFTVVLDITDFEYMVEEVKLMAEDAERAYGDIEAFLKKYT